MLLRHIIQCNSNKISTPLTPRLFNSLKTYQYVYLNISTLNLNLINEVPDVTRRLFLLPLLEQRSIWLTLYEGSGGKILPRSIPDRNPHYGWTVLGEDTEVHNQTHLLKCRSDRVMTVETTKIHLRTKSSMETRKTRLKLTSQKVLDVLSHNALCPVTKVQSPGSKSTRQKKSGSLHFRGLWWSRVLGILTF